MLKKTVKSISLAAVVAASLTATVTPVAQAGTEAYLGEITMVGFGFAPRGTAFCNGQLLAISSNSALFSLLGTTYGGDGRTTFALPDLRGRTAIHPGQGPGLSTYAWGQRGGQERVTLTIAEMPSHNHGATTTLSGVQVNLHGYSGTGNSGTPDGTVLSTKSRTNIYSTNAPDVMMSSAAATVSGSASTTVTNTGGSQSHENRMPFLGIYHVIATVGIYPSRN